MSPLAVIAIVLGVCWLAVLAVGAGLVARYLRERRG
jgi:hypothetical protein